MKQMIKQALAIPVQAVENTKINNNSFCIKLVSETTFTAKQKDKSTQKYLLVSSFPLSVASFAATNIIQQKIYSDKAAGQPSELFIYYRKLLI